jgi:hypothetical protein
MASLPPSVSDVDIRDWENLSPHQLLSDPTRTVPDPDRPAVARALKYARAGPSLTYDEIGFRTVAAIPMMAKGPVTPITLQTLTGMRVEKEQAERRWLQPELAELLDQQLKLRHRPIELPEGGRYRYRVQRDYIHFTRILEAPHGTVEDGDVWTFPITAPPRMVLDNAVDRDVSPLFTQVCHVDLPGVFWLPLTALIEQGQFLPMQRWGPVLVEDIKPGCFYGFVSHRWLSREHPDPQGVQARFCAWQLFSHLCEAVRVAGTRGLHAPRKFNALIGFPVGVKGTELAESLLVNVLRDTLDDAMLEQAVEEVTSIESLTRDYGVSAAADVETAMGRLARILEEQPVLRMLTERLHVWYDYSCLPQVPRSDSEEALFRQGLEHLNLTQLMGRTLVLLDEVEDYMSRAWCTLETLVADSFNAAIDLLVGSGRAQGHRGEAEHYFWEVHADRPHIVWRALLDTEVFRVQTPVECMDRLGVRVTDARDLPFIYQRLLDFVAPTKIHVDGSELLTGVIPLPVTHGGTSVLWITSTERRATFGADPAAARTLDWTDARRIPTGWDAGEGDDAARVLPFQILEADTRSPAPDPAPSCHVAVVASCEGESVMLANWALKHRSDLEGLLDVPMSSISWLATDIAPVGHFVQGDLRAIAIDAEVVVILAMSVRFSHCTITSSLAQLMPRAGRKTVLFSVDDSKSNVTLLDPSGDPLEVPDADSRYRTVPLANKEFPAHPGGLFRSDVVQHLVD